MLLRSIKEINRLMIKIMSSFYLTVPIETNLSFQKFGFPSLKNSSPGQLLASSNSDRFDWILKLVTS